MAGLNVLLQQRITRPAIFHGRNVTHCTGVPRAR